MLSASQIGPAAAAQQKELNDIAPQAGMMVHKRITIGQLRAMFRRAKGVSVWTKLTLERRINAFTEEFYWYHKGQKGLTLATMQTRFLRLHSRIVNVLAPQNPKLSSNFDRARGRLWFAYSDPEAFASGFGRGVIKRVEGTVDFMAGEH